MTTRARLLPVVLAGLSLCATSARAEDEECDDVEDELVEVATRQPARHRAEPRFAVKLLGGSSGVMRQGEASSDRPGFAAIIGAELRLSDWLSVRSDVDFRPNGLSWDAIGLKLRVPWRVSPYVSASASIPLTGSFSVGPVGAVGLDVRLGRLFLELEGAYRVAPSETLRRAGQVSWMLGVGYALD